MALGLTQPLTEMNKIKNNNSWRVKVAVAYGWQSYYHLPIVLKSGSLNLLEPYGPVQTCNGIALPFTTTHTHTHTHTCPRATVPLPSYRNTKDLSPSDNVHNFQKSSNEFTSNTLPLLSVFPDTLCLPSALPFLYLVAYLKTSAQSVLSRIMGSFVDSEGWRKMQL
jgi:hypothetical protein